MCAGQNSSKSVLTEAEPSRAVYPVEAFVDDGDVSHVVRPSSSFSCDHAGLLASPRRRREMDSGLVAEQD